MIVGKTICFFPRERLEQKYYTLATGSITEQDDIYSGLFPDLNLFSNVDPVIRDEFILRYLFSWTVCWYLRIICFLQVSHPAN